MIRILHCVNDMHRAGLETMLMNYYRNIDRSKIQFDFLTHRPYKSDYDDEIIALGGRVYYAPRLYPKNYPKYFKWMKNFFKKHPEYLIVHSHIDSMSYLPLRAAKKAGIPIRIAHSHNSSLDKDYKYLLKQFFRSRINKVANIRFSCGEEAGKFLYKGKDFIVIPNAVDAKKFYYNEELRHKKRNELGIINEFVIGNVGRLEYQKNHVFLLKVFKEILKVEPNSLLLIVGDGKKRKQLEKLVIDMGIINNVRFLGNRSDVHELYQVFDVFVLPSLFEGIPLVGVEAQLSDLPCFFSDKVSKEVRFNSKSQFINLEAGLKTWADAIIAVKKQNRIVNKQEIKQSIYDITVAHTNLEDIYRKLLIDLNREVF